MHIRLKKKKYIYTNVHLVVWDHERYWSCAGSMWMHSASHQTEKDQSLRGMCDWRILWSGQWLQRREITQPLGESRRNLWFTRLSLTRCFRLHLLLPPDKVNPLAHAPAESELEAMLRLLQTRLLQKALAKLSKMKAKSISRSTWLSCRHCRTTSSAILEIKCLDLLDAPVWKKKSQQFCLGYLSQNMM